MNTHYGGGPDRIELMQTFIRIVESGSLSAAAMRLNTTQPTICLLYTSPSPRD